MRSTLVSQFGDPRQVIALVDAERVAPGPGEVEVALSLAAINPSDLIPVTGAYSARTTLPFVPGFEGFGTVARVGAGVTSLKPGDRVIPIGASGLWQEYLLRPAEWCFALPDDISDRDAATSYVNPLTALQLIEAPRVHFGSLEGRRVGVTAAGSAIGGMLMKLLVGEQVDAVGIVRSQRSADRLAVEAPGRIVLGNEIRLPDLRLDAIIDAVGGPFAGDLILRTLEPGGAFIQYGALSGVPVPQTAILARSDIRFSFLWLRTWVHSAGRAAIEAAFAKSFDGLRSGLFSSRIAAVYPLSQLDAALAHQADAGRDGKLLLDPRC
ncbi:MULTISPECIES: zinc-dependent alcohol dehydrogenase family protein [unclassified Ensifer]|uniref:zinc-dependent alcohol dehydrogenase family protein n=1 Tax=unclassified Ensifer TaxID=2633371 RepID=UPI000812DC8F|nr:MULTISPECIES: zinc-dependent alcohol dehydrogenase family protein [unclassified Ensifer]OCO99864.1 oxidoreductase [Ensifer sp. LC14]OCP06137.1 oxidoreductase [Ensifer sp. LC11]OCP07086.1 oxidoreductase [Ensifer sp. LC13]OCP31544.1 oxidoreductase [Ensifer sp. LC499]